MSIRKLLIFIMVLDIVGALTGFLVSAYLHQLNAAMGWFISMALFIIIFLRIISRKW